MANLLDKAKKSFEPEIDCSRNLDFDSFTVIPFAEGRTRDSDEPKSIDFGQCNQCGWYRERGTEEPESNNFGRYKSSGESRIGDSVNSTLGDTIIIMNLVAKLKCKYGTDRLIFYLEKLLYE